jgi:putative tryptophan/tyrosine transport system substrate-binding protein
MDRRRFLVTSLAGVVAAPRGVSAQRSVRPTIGMLHLSSAAKFEGFRQAFLEGLHQQGYVEDETVAIEYRYADGDTGRLPSLATELLSLKVRIIVTSGTTSVQAVKNVTTTIPIVIAVGADPVEMGFAKSLARPGGNITGLSILGSEIATKRLDLLHQAVPRARVVAFLVQAANPGNPIFVKAMTTAAASLGLQIYVVKARVGDDLPDAFAEMSRAKAEAVVIIEDAIFAARAKEIGDLALSHRLPTMLGNRLFVYAGGLMAYGLVYEDLWRRSAGYVARILKGANPAEMPIEQPNKFDLIINLKTAKALGLTIPPSLLARADQVIE